MNMKLWLIILLLLIFHTMAYGEVFKLKNGETVEGEIISEGQDDIVIKTKYGTIGVDKKELLPREIKLLPPAEDVQPLQNIKSPPKTSGLTKRNDLLCMDRWLMGQINPKTGLLESYRPTSDVCLENQAATYDQALAGLVFLVLGKKEEAQKILEFYKKKWNGKGFSNFYFTPTGNSGIESTVHLGPNMWIALLALHYDRMTGREKYQKFAEDMVVWAMSLPHYKGGAVMSGKDEWRAPWTKVVSTENNIDYYAVLNILENRVKDLDLKEKIRQEKIEVANYLRKTAYDKRSGGINRGFHEGAVDGERALDTASWLISAVGIEKLRQWGIDTEKLLAFIEAKFLVKDGDVKGFDFTDKKGALKAKRARMVSVEWTLAMVNAYCAYMRYYDKLADGLRKMGNFISADKMDKKARLCEHKIAYYLKQMDKTLMKFGRYENLYSYPYATRSYWLVFFDSPWWKTPKADNNGNPAGSVASTAWRIFAGRFNPLNSEGIIE